MKIKLITNLSNGNTVTIRRKMKKTMKTLGPVFKAVVAIILEPSIVAAIIAILDGINRML